ncbi:S1C family serine protease [Membranihabitans maritimus]|uniref:S1C family serine protease n=1 Tax=Membranihabitans maritimus TaxID=2904244 RepID=UPI001F2EC79E|nr:trypsin-like peptidase domain-containing protein [Membranihabitans maritimus]
MKSSLRYFFTALLASLFTIGLFKIFDKPETIIIRERIPSTSLIDQNKLGGSASEFVKRNVSTYKVPVNKDIFDNNLKALVQIKSGKKKWFGKFYSNKVNQNGSGVIISDDGYIATNYHVIEDSDDIEVIMWNKRSVSAKLIGFDAKTDLGLLKIEMDSLHHIEFGNSDHLSIGDKIFALGHPFKMDATVTEGIISGKHRQLGLSDNPNFMESFIQTDAVINPGNSGGALINQHGQLIGINTAILTRSGNFEGYAFAIPSNLAYKILTDLKDYGYVNRGILGIKAIFSKIDEFALSKKYASGARIEDVEPNSPADWGGLRNGDYILELNDQQLQSINHLKEILWSIDPGHPLSLVYLRNATLDTLTVNLIQESDNPDYPLLLKFGIEIRDLQENEIMQNQINGIRIESIFRESMAESLNIKPGFIIMRINDREVFNTVSFYEKFTHSGDDIVIAGRYPGEKQTYYYSFNINHLVR